MIKKAAGSGDRTTTPSPFGKVAAVHTENRELRAKVESLTAELAAAQERIRQLEATKDNSLLLKENKELKEDIKSLKAGAFDALMEAFKQGRSK